MTRRSSACEPYNPHSIERADSSYQQQQPYWLPTGEEFKKLPERLQHAIRLILQPAYQELVVDSQHALSQSTGLTIVHLMWLEMLDQLEIGLPHSGSQQEPDVLSGSGAKDGRLEAIDRLLRTVGAKHRASEFLQRMREFRTKHPFECYESYAATRTLGPLYPNEEGGWTRHVPPGRETAA